MNKAVLISLSLLFVIVSPIASQGQVSDDRLVIPGVRLGKRTLQMSLADLTAVNGEPRISKWNPDPNAYNYFIRPTTFYYWPDFVAASRDGTTVDYLYSLPILAYATEKGIRSKSSTADEVRAAYGRPSYVIPVIPPFQERFIYDSLGLFFVLALDEVGSIGVFRPRSASSYWLLPP